MKNSFYFPHDYDASTDKKVARLRAKYGWKGYGIYWAIVEALAREKGYIEKDVIGITIGDASDTVIAVLDYCLEIELLEENKEGVHSKRLLEHIKDRKKYYEDKRQAGKKGAEARWGDSTANGTAIALPMANDGKGKERKGKENNKGFEKVTVKYAKEYLKSKQFRLDRNTYPTVESLINAWKDHHVAKGTKIKDYKASFRTWCRNAPEFGGLKIMKTEAQKCEDEGLPLAGSQEYLKQKQKWEEK